MDYDSRPETYAHSARVGTLMQTLLIDATARSFNHDHSKTRDPELEIFNQFTPLLKRLKYGSEEYRQALKDMGSALTHHYAANRHHPEHFGTAGIDGMTLVDLIEMLADWKAATERMTDGSLKESLVIQKQRFGISDQLYQILVNTAAYYGLLDLDDADELRDVLDDSDPEAK